MEGNEEIFPFQALKEKIGHLESNTTVPKHFSEANSAQSVNKPQSQC